jgi:hypothetical protein
LKPTARARWLFGAWPNVDLKAKSVSIVENRVNIGKENVTGTPKCTYAGADRGDRAWLGLVRAPTCPGCGGCSRAPQPMRPKRTNYAREARVSPPCSPWPQSRAGVLSRRQQALNQVAPPTPQHCYTGDELSYLKDLDCQQIVYSDAIAAVDTGHMVCH